MAFLLLPYQFTVLQPEISVTLLSLAIWAKPHPNPMFTYPILAPPGPEERGSVGMSGSP
jgi:hypothetical protein